MKNAPYFIGLDIGTDSVGYAVTDQQYKLLKYKGEPMWGVHTFEAAKLAQERRANRTARRRLSRQKMRVQLTQELFAPVIAPIDPRFFIRINQSSLIRETAGDAHVFFNDPDFTDADYFDKYPTIHHLICDLMNSGEPHDPRLVYLACGWLVAHRGHFLSEVDKNHVSDVLDFNAVYNELISRELFGEVLPWEYDEPEKIGDILKRQVGITQKTRELTNLLYGGKKPRDDFEAFPYSREGILKLLAGGECKASKLYNKPEYDDTLPKASLKLGMADEDFVAVCAALDEDAELLRRLKAVYDWAVLNDVLAGKSCISEAKVAVYDRHAADLAGLKAFVRRYLPKKYSEIFRAASDKNYVAYSYHTGRIGAEVKKKANQADFCDYIKKIVKTVKAEDIEPADVAFYSDMLARLELGTFMPKQVNTDNRVIPHQLYWDELRRILDNAQTYLPFLVKKDGDGITGREKLESIFLYRIPYYVGPLCSYKNENAWIVRKTEGKILPWNFDERVDLDACEEAFIRNLTNTCTYFPGADVLPKNSLLYTKFMVLNEINNLKLDDQKIPVSLKQDIFNDLFMTRKTVTVKAIQNYLKSRGYEGTLSGVDEKIKSTMYPVLAFSSFIDNGILTEEQVETIIMRMACVEDRTRLRHWLVRTYPDLSKEAVQEICRLKFRDFGRLSREFLTELYGTEADGSGEAFTVIEALWETNCNLMELLSSRFTFSRKLQELQRQYYQSNHQSLSDRLDDMWVSNAVKRPIIRTLDIVNDVVKAKGYAPKKIFVEMARDVGGEQKGQRTKTRKQQLLELYKKTKDEDVRLMSKQLEDMGDTADNRLQSDKLFLYYLQLGKCAYTGAPMSLESVMHGDGTYNIEHIYPQCFVKDDSITNNKVLVDARVNGEKSDQYPIDSAIRQKMYGIWHYWKEIGLITEEKFKRLTRATPFTEEEKYSFINRQLVETRQSTKAVATLLGERYAETEIVYVKAGLVSDFRHEFGLLKSRAVNDLHHAKDAYLNIVVGNVYNERFSRRWFTTNQNYSIKTKTVFTRPVQIGGRVIWKGADSIALAKQTVRKNTAHMTRYAFCRTGALFDQMPVKAAPGLVPLKAGMPTEVYGGYNKAAATFFMLVKFWVGNAADAMIMPVELMYRDRFLADAAFAEEYAKKTISGIRNKVVTEVEFPLGMRPIKINTVFSLDGFRCCITGKSSGGKSIILMPLMPLSVGEEMEQYIKAIESFCAKKAKNPALIYDENYDKVCKADNLRLYDVLRDKACSSIYSKRPAMPAELLKNGREKFAELDVVAQCSCLMQILQLFGRMTVGCDLTGIGGAGRAASTVGFSAYISNWKKNYSDVRIIDSSASGLHERVSENLLELMK